MGIPAAQIERDTGTKILHFEKGDFQGDEFYPAPHIYEACAKAIHDGHVRYVPGPGLPELRAAIAEEMTSRGRPTKREEVLVTMGAKHALTQSLLTIVDQGDEVIFPNPGYPPDEFWITYAGIWILPVVGLWLSLRGRERPLLWASLAMALATLLSNKEYLGSPRYEWDPIVFGLLLMGTATGVRRWLAAGDGGIERVAAVAHDL